MIFGGLEKFSLIDYPGKSCAIAFTVGCNFRCPYCHNPELVVTTSETVTIPGKIILNFLKTRVGKLDALTITGGEPTLHTDLLAYIQKVKHLGFLIKLDSNGTRPDVLKQALERKLVDYIAMDVKAPLRKYAGVVARPVAEEKIKESIALLKNSGIDYEFRTTIVRSQLSKKDILEIGDVVSGARRYYLQKFVPGKLNNPAYVKEHTYSDEELEVLQKEIAKKVQMCGIR
jgi:pyruvate formate lyase activating enzyme